MNNPSDEPLALAHLLSRSGQGDSRAFAELYACTSSRLFGVCLRMLRDRQEAEEVLQEVFVTVWRRSADFDSRLATAMTWLITLARHRAIDRLRQRRTQLPPDSIDFDNLADERAGPPAEAELSQQYARLRRCLEGLEPRDRYSIREAFFAGATYKELAERSQQPLGTLKSRIRRALAQLRTCLET